MKSIIIDDEIKSAENLKILLTDFCEDVTVTALCQNIKDGVNAIKNDAPDVVFLDINLQRETGFDLFQHFDKVPFEVIFTTAYSEFAIKAFRYSALDYLLKPIDIKELQEAVRKVSQRITGNLNNRLMHLFKDLKSPNHDFLKLALPTLEGLIFINVSEIVYCEAASNYTTFFLTANRKYVVSKTLKEYDELLTERDFFRIHNSYLVNIRAIKKYVKGDGGYVILENDVSLDVSKRKKEAFLQKMGVKA
jgi:two-component system LytT family response regulator